MMHQLLKNYRKSWMSIMNSVDEQSFEVLETSQGMATPTLRAKEREESKERVENLWAHSDNMVKNLKDQVDQIGAQEKPMDSPQKPDVPENPEENEDQRIVKVFIFQVFHLTVFSLFLRIRAES